MFKVITLAVLLFMYASVTMAEVDWQLPHDSRVVFQEETNVNDYVLLNEYNSILPGSYGTKNVTTQIKTGKHSG